MNWNSSMLWGIIGLVGGFLVSFLFYRLAKKEKKIMCKKDSKVLITNNISQIPELKILYKDSSIMNLSTTTLTLEVIGRDTIEKNDFALASPLRIETSGEFLLTNNIESTLTYNSRPMNQVKPIVVDSNIIYIDYDYLAKYDVVKFTILHTGELNIKGDLKSGVLLKDSSKRRGRKNMTIMMLILYTFTYIFLGIEDKLCDYKMVMRVGQCIAAVTLSYTIIFLCIRLIVLNREKKKDVAMAESAKSNTTSQ